GFASANRSCTRVRPFPDHGNSIHLRPSEPSEWRFPERTEGAEGGSLRLVEFLLRDPAFVDQSPTSPLVCFFRLTIAMIMRTRPITVRSEEHTSELQSPCNLVC